MKVGMMFANAGPWCLPDNAGAMAAAAEEFGVESLWTVEHVVVPKDYKSPYPYSPTGKMPGPEETPIPDPLVWLAFMAARTTTVRLCTGILILPQRHPAVTAKEVATLDVLSNGRVTLGVGVGWLAEEFAVLGIPFEERAGRTDEAIESLRAFWTQDEPTFHGRYYDFEGAKSHPRPVQPGGVPIHVGGHTKAAARRAGRLGDGFFPGTASFEDLGGLLDEMRKAAVDAGRDPDAIEVTAGGAMDLDGIRRYEDAGVHRMIIPPLAFDADGLRTNLEMFATNVLSKL
ncbi:MAG TPA: LLM class F420-dependent oxidoreductase [Acidimicrobiales bacterium]|nr:LLM class F420-dependent oxidoreductase [Acidimicrobiales bacterium]